MQIHMIFEADEELGATWLIDAWDEYSIDGNYEGYEAAIKKARKDSETGNIRIIKTTVDDDKVLAAFAAPHIENTNEESN